MFGVVMEDSILWAIRPSMVLIQCSAAHPLTKLSIFPFIFSLMKQVEAIKWNWKEQNDAFHFCRQVVYQ